MQFGKMKLPDTGYLKFVLIVYLTQNFNMQRYCKLFIIIFFIIGLLFNNQSFGNSGFGGGTTLVLEHSQYPAALIKYNATEVYVLYWGTGFTAKELQGNVLHDDTIINYKKFIATYPNGTGFRLIYKSKDKIDSVYQFDAKFRITDKAYPMNNGKIYFLTFDSTLKKTDEFVFNYTAKILSTKKISSAIALQWLLREYKMYNSYDRSNYASGAVWILSIGIDDYGTTQYKNCKTDAKSYNDFFKTQFTDTRSAFDSSALFHEYVLLDKDATKDAILFALKDIAGKAAFNDYFIFNFSGQSNLLTKDSVKFSTYFFPYNVKGNISKPENRNSGDTNSVLNNLISLNILQEYIQSIPAINQLFISEAGPSAKFKTEFVKALMQNSPEIATILNKNRVIIVPNSFGWDYVKCKENNIQKGPINYYITSLESENIFDIFNEDKANKVAFNIKNKAYACQSFGIDYFEIFFERKFLKEYKEIFGDGVGQTRGVALKTKELRSAANFSGRQYALVVGTNNYKGAGWKNLPNAINDARAVSDMLAQGYGFEVQLLEDKPMDTIYKAIGEYYRKLNPTDQLVLYFAGHGDMENEFMDDGFIVCSDSRSRADDPARNTYIQYVKLQKMINRIPARQILVMLDVCHGGAFNQKRSDPGKTIANRNVRQFLVDQSQYTCRKFLSSVGNEEAFDGKPGDHSPFAKLLLQVLNAKGKETNGIITLSDIFSVLQVSSMNETATLKISPQKDGFGSDNPQSDFILIPVEKQPVKQ